MVAARIVGTGARECGPGLEWVRELDLAIVLARLGREAESRSHREKAVKLNPLLQE